MDIFLNTNNYSTTNELYTDSSDTFENINDNINISIVNNINKPVIKQDKLIIIRLKDDDNNRYKLLPRLKKLEKCR